MKNCKQVSIIDTMYRFGAFTFVKKELRKFVLILFFVVPISIYSQQNELQNPEIIELEVKHVDGFGSFVKSYGRVSLEMRNLNPSFTWGKTYDKMKGIPEDWEDAVVTRIVFDWHQFAYQNFMAGKLKKAVYEDLVKGWEINFDERKLSAEPINCYINIVVHQNHHSQFKYILDKNNNLDFSDDEVVHAPYFFNMNDLDSFYKIYSHEIDYETLIAGKKVEKKLKLLLMNDNRGNLATIFPQHGEVTFKNHVIKFSSGSASLLISKKVKLISYDSNGKANDIEPVEYMGFIEIDGDYYQNLGYSHDKQVIRLQKVAKDKNEIFSSQVNFKAFPFEGKEFTTDSSIKLEDYKGKFVFIEFWATWCGPCLEDMPKINATYDSLGKENIVFIGIVNGDSEALKKLIKHFDIQWANILSDDENKIIEKYHVQAYPSSILINPEGVVIAKNIRSPNLLNTILDLMEE